MIARPTRWSPRLFLFLSPVLVFPIAMPPSASAEVRLVASQGEYRMGDRDTKEVSVRLATEEAKRDALEQAATYLESVTVVEDRAVTRDEINTYTAGLVVVLDQQTSMTLDGDTVVVTVALTAEVDTEEVAQALTVLREQKDARHQLDALRLENDGLRRDLVEIHRMLEQASTFDQTQQISQQRQDILNRAQSNALVSQAWTDWVLIGPASFPAGRAGGIGAAHTLALLNAAQGLSPNSPHVQRAKGTIAIVQSAAPPAMPVASNQTAGAAMQSPPLKTLNEITRAAPTAGSPAAGSLGSAQSRRGFPMPASGAFLAVPENQRAGIAPRSIRTLRQFLQSPPTERLPPVINGTAPRTQQLQRGGPRSAAGGRQSAGRAASAPRSGVNGR